MNKIFLFDFDGTLVTEDILDVVCDIVGKKEESQQINEGVINGTKTGLQPLCQRINFLKGVTYDQIKDKLNENNYLREGVVELFKYLNEKVLPHIDRSKKFKIYLSPLTILNIDIHNRISLTDSRLLRRIVRDNRTRGYKVEDTLKVWRKVRLGEEKHIFPNQDAADVVFNTALIYELGVLKTYVEPLLYSVSIESPCYEEAVRLINMLNTFQPIPSDAVPEDSLLREFIGGSCYNS